MLTIKRGDTRKGIVSTLQDEKGADIDLTDASVRFIAINEKGVKTVEGEAFVVDEATVAYAFTVEQVAQVGKLTGEFEVTYPNGSIETFPDVGGIPIEIIADRG